MIVPISVLILVAHAVNAAPLPYHNSRALASRQFDLGGIGDFLGFSGSDDTSDASAAGNDASSDSSSGSGVGKVADFLGLGGDDSSDAAPAPAAAAAATPAAEEDDSFGSKIADSAGKVADFLGFGGDDSDAAAASPAPAAAATGAPAAAAAPAPAPAPAPAAPATADDATANDAAANDAPADDTNAADASAVGACGPPGINDATVSLIKSFEGFVASPEPDPIGLPTVGFGHLCESSGCAEVPFSFPLSQGTAAQLLQNDVKQFVSCINGAVSDNVVLNDNQLGALTSWSFNVGCGAAKGSTLMKRLNKGEDPNTVAAQELPKFNKAGGKVFAGLTRRRAAEVKLFQTPSDVKAHPC